LRGEIETEGEIEGETEGDSDETDSIKRLPLPSSSSIFDESS
jgi:hypothetical protein